MTLPTSGRRTRQFILDEDEEEETPPKIEVHVPTVVKNDSNNGSLRMKIKLPKVPTLKLSKLDIFLTALGRWYDNLGPRDKGRLTKKKLKRRAVLEASKTLLAYARIPVNWLHILMQRHGLKLYKRIKDYSYFEEMEKRKQRRLARMGKSLDSETTNNTENGEKLIDLLQKSEVVTSFGRVSKVPKSFVIPWSNGTPKSRDQNSSHFRKKPEKRLKKIIDLSHVPPPQWWVDKHKDGFGPRRELTIYTTDDKTIVFYDYQPPSLSEKSSTKTWHSCIF